MRQVLEQIQPVVRVASRVLAPAPRELEVPADVLAAP